MTLFDPRLTLARDGVASRALEGLLRADQFQEVRPMRCGAPAAALRDAARVDAEQHDQLLFGEDFDVLLEADGFALGQARRDGYVGYVSLDALEPRGGLATHWVRALRTYAFAEPDMKSQILGLYSMNTPIVAEAVSGRFMQAEGAGWVYAAHLAPWGWAADDPAAIAEQFVGAPYQWGGRESLGLDCSGLVQQALYACGQACPRDTDMQAEALGRPLDQRELARGDLVFWPGHVGMMLDETRLIHATSFHMMTAIEPLDEAMGRIAAEGEPAPSGYRRLTVNT